jgi:signal transduction histidine kinase
MRHNLFCAVKEALNNVLKHSKATKVRVEFVANVSEFQVIIADNGTGFMKNGTGAAGERVNHYGGNGLPNMHERLSSIAGRCNIESERGKGTRAMFSVPLKG